MSQVLDKFFAARVNNVYCPWCMTVQPKLIGERTCENCGNAYVAHEVTTIKYWSEKVRDSKIQCGSDSV